MQLSDFDYNLPQELIAQTPIGDRAASRLLVLNKQSGEINHHTFRDIMQILKKGDCLVINNTRVMPARLLGLNNGKPIEVLLLNNTKGNNWETLVKPGKQAEVGAVITFGESGELSGKVIEITDEGNRIIEMQYDGIFNEILDRLGEMPLPPYITEKLEDKERYQTVYNRHLGSAAAPTAGLHFTTELMDELKAAGIHFAEITLHVGIGTFRPVRVDNPEEHHMHAEFFNIEQTDADMINQVKQNGGRIIAVGTTVCRTLESCVGDDGLLEARQGWTDMFIYPGYKFQILNGLITNFHLPKSTLVMLVSALAGRENILTAYNEAVRERYRFFSFGDAMLII
ncbi:MAG: tRNA preQ1(34) S-adenosylmethionine ribosyltransferase-isomerase QueA [Defluviitaleaceae bacterium]|nr:tRNA preQ1(34) S-adenosylmethionine ribosyltransferase-isomerase QueA [Defluviitaleaceae bacterium]